LFRTCLRVCFSAKITSRGRVLRCCKGSRTCSNQMDKRCSHYSPRCCSVLSSLRHNNRTSPKSWQSRKLRRGGKRWSTSKRNWRY
jgi:hypothetical protein